MLRIVCSQIKKRFPTYQHLVDAGLMTKNELDAFLEAEAASKYGVWWVPICWATGVAEQAWQSGCIKHNRHLIKINDELIKIRNGSSMIICYDWINLPIIYNQVVIFGVYFHLIASLFGRQFISPEVGGRDHLDYIFPIFSSMQLIFYLGWLKIAEVLLDPFGEDDDDFDVNFLVDRSIQVGFLMGDSIGRFPPSSEKDKFWEEGVPSELPYTVASLPFRLEEDPVGNGDVDVPRQEQKIVKIDDKENISVHIDKTKDEEREGRGKDQIPLDEHKMKII